MSLIGRILLTASIGAIGSVGITLWASSIVLSRYWVSNITISPPSRLLITAQKCDLGTLPTTPLRFGQRSVDFYSRDSLVPARNGGPPFPSALAFGARKGDQTGVRLGGMFGGSTVGYHRFANPNRCAIALIRLTRSPVTRFEVQVLGATAALFAALAATLGAYFIIARPMMRRVAAVAAAAGQVGSASFISRKNEDWSDLALIDQGLSGAHERIVANEKLLSGRAAEIEDLLNAIAHDLKTPLAIIQLILQQSPDGVGSASEIGRAMAEVQHANALLENLELGAQLRNGDLVAAFSPIDLTAIVADSAGRFTLLGESLGMVVNVAWPDQSLWAQGDVVLFNRIISNLIHNAVRHSHGKHVALSITGQTYGAQVRIADDGVGLPLEAQQTLLATAGVAPDVPTTPLGFHGRGLLIVRRLCDIMNIEIKIETAPAFGTAILLNVPLLAAGPPPIILK